MEEFFTKTYAPAWILILALALYYPVRQLIWVLYVRRAKAQAAQQGGDAKESDEAMQTRLKRRASVTAALLSRVFSAFYTTYLFRDQP